MFGNKKKLNLFLLIKDHPTFTGVEPKFWPQIETSLTRINLNHNQEILLTGDNDIYFLVSGTVNVIEADTKAMTSDKTIYTGEVINIMTFFGDNVNLHKIIAVEHAVLIKVSKSSIQKIKSFPLMLKNISKHLYHKLNYSEDILEKSAKATTLMIKHELKEEKIKTLLAKFFITAVSFYACFVLLVGLTIELSNKIKFFEVFFFTARVAIGLFLVITLIKILTEAIFKYQDLGLNLNNVFKNVTESIVYSIFICALLTLLKYYLITTFELFKDFNLFENALLTLDYPYLRVLVYMFHASLQEFFIRCLGQVPLTFLYISAFVDSYEKISKARPVILGIVISNLVFSSVHALNSFVLATASFILGIFWGWLFYKQKSIVGPIVSHIIIGIFAFYFLNIDPLVLQVNLL